MRNLKGAIGLAAVATLALSAVPVVAQEGEAFDICFIHEDLETEFWLAGHKAMTETLRAQGHNVLERYGPDANEQLELLNDCIAQDVDGIFVIPKDGSIALTLIEQANAADIPIGIFNRPPQSEDGAAIVVQADNRTIARDAVQYIYDVAKEMGKESVTPLIMVGDLGDPNAVGRYEGFYDVINSDPEFFGQPIEVPTKWDAATAQANLQAAMAANPEVDFLFTSSDFLFPTIKGILEPMGKWVTRDDPNHVLMAGLDGDVNACRQIKDGFVDSTGVQDLYFEAELMLNALLEAIETGETQPDAWLDDPGFALTAGNLAEREMDMWGCILLAEQGSAG
ncbi:MAG TPA: sugar ABC transporter substrate-binding protein [Anaerolineae bacterium]|jgi:ABC-type sugar transport system substrate-binding protein|nr:sugar ABC transporter substrate-binding protein [Anaerolineae bacterium]